MEAKGGEGKKWGEEGGVEEGGKGKREGGGMFRWVFAWKTPEILLKGILWHYSFAYFVFIAGTKIGFFLVFRFFSSLRSSNQGKVRTKSILVRLLWRCSNISIFYFIMQRFVKITMYGPNVKIYGQNVKIYGPNRKIFGRNGKKCTDGWNSWMECLWWRKQNFFYRQ